MKDVHCGGGASIYMHTDKLLEGQVEEKVLLSLQKALKLGARAEGTSVRYRVYRDIHSGGMHTSTIVQLPKLDLAPEMIPTAAKMDLLYCTGASRAPYPILRVYLKQEFPKDPERKPTRKLAFETGGLEPANWSTTDILKLGYLSYPTMHTDDLKLDPEGTTRVELVFDNNAGFVHIPLRFGLRLYYIPELPTPDDESEQSDDDEEKRKELMRLRLEEQAAKMVAKSLFEQVVEQDGLSEHADSEGFERELFEDMDQFYQMALFGEFGPRKQAVEEASIWSAAVETSQADANLGEQASEKPPWWEGQGTIDSNVSFGDDADGSKIAGAGSVGGGGRGAEYKHEAEQAAKNIGSSMLSSESVQTGPGPEVVKALARKEFERLRGQAVEKGKEQQYQREQRAKEIETQGEREAAEVAEIVETLSREREDVEEGEDKFPSFTALCKARKRACQPEVACNVLLATMNFTPAAPPPSPRASKEEAR